MSIDFKRKTISKKLRFEVFKRDSFSCLFCGRTPPSVILEIDHVLPVSINGGNEIDNLITSCFDCNRGKGAQLLSSIPMELAERKKILKLKEDQMKEYSKLLIDIEKRVVGDVEKINVVFEELWPGRTLSNYFKQRTLRNFISRLPSDEIINALYIAFGKKGRCNSLINYWCGICWKTIKKTSG